MQFNLTALINQLTTDWKTSLLTATTFQTFNNLETQVVNAYAHSEVFPQFSHIFRAFSFFNMAATNVVILGQDPYHNQGQANGLAFGINEGCKVPPSLKNIFRELENDLHVSRHDYSLVP